jgi:hypothetical protein
VVEDAHLRDSRVPAFHLQAIKGACGESGVFHFHKPLALFHENHLLPDDRLW